DFALATSSTSNRPPELAYSIPNQTATEGASFTYQISAGLFSDPDGNSLSYSAALSDGTDLPSWLNFEPATRTFSGTSPVGAAGTSVRVTANDGEGGSSSTDFILTTQPAVTVSGPVASGWSQTLSYNRGQDSVALGNMVVDPDPNTELT